MNFPPPSQPARDMPFINWREATPHEAGVVIPAAYAGELASGLAVLAGLLTAGAPTESGEVQPA